MKITTIKAGEGFTYDDSPQRSPEWVKIRASRIGASQLGDWMAVGVNGKPLKSRTDLEREVAFAKTFNQPFSRFVNGAMQAGIDNEDFMADQYSSAMGTPLEKCGCFYNDYFVASPDRLVGDDGLVEIKWLQDAAFTNVVSTGEPGKSHNLQMQGQMWATDRKWCDYVVGSANTGRFVVITVKRDEDTIKRIADSVVAVKDIEPLKTDGVFEFTSGAPIVNNERIWE